MGGIPGADVGKPVLDRGSRCDWTVACLHPKYGTPAGTLWGDTMWDLYFSDPPAPETFDISQLIPSGLSGKALQQALAPDAAFDAVVRGLNISRKGSGKHLGGRVPEQTSVPAAALEPAMTLDSTLDPSG